MKLTITGTIARFTPVVLHNWAADEVTGTLRHNVNPRAAHEGALNISYGDRENNYDDLPD